MRGAAESLGGSREWVAIALALATLVIMVSGDSARSGASDVTFPQPFQSAITRTGERESSPLASHDFLTTQLASGGDDFVHSGHRHRHRHRESECGERSVVGR